MLELNSLANETSYDFFISRSNRVLISHGRPGFLYIYKYQDATSKYVLNQTFLESTYWKVKMSDTDCRLIINKNSF